MHSWKKLWGLSSGGRRVPGAHLFQYLFFAQFIYNLSGRCPAQFQPLSNLRYCHLRIVLKQCDNRLLVSSLDIPGLFCLHLSCIQHGESSSLYFPFPSGCGPMRNRYVVLEANTVFFLTIQSGKWLQLTALGNPCVSKHIPAYFS